MKHTEQQKEGISHLQSWRVGALFMEAGTGKTRVACELINSTDTDLIVWIGPLRTIRTSEGVTSIAEEIAKWGGVRADVYYYGVESISGSERVYLELMERVRTASKPFVVVDESLKIKNSTAKRTKRVIEIGKYAHYKLILNGTPLSRNLLDLWAQMEFLSPQILSMTETQFKDTFCKYTTITRRLGRSSYTKEFITGYENIDYLYSLIRHYVYSCDLHLNITQNYKEYHCELYNTDEYYELKEMYLDDEVLLWKNNNIFLEMTQKMQHSYCCDEAKFEVVNEIFKDIPQEKTIIFCKYIDSRNECLKRYPKAMVLSYQKESLGLNLQQYRHTIYFDKIWDLALRVQSGRRTYRTGQEYDCFYYDITCNVGLEKLINTNITKKVGMTEYFKGKTKEQLYEEL